MWRTEAEYFIISLIADSACPVKTIKNLNLHFPVSVVPSVIVQYILMMKGNGKRRRKQIFLYLGSTIIDYEY